MAKEIGRLTGIGIGKETTRKTAVAPSFWLPWADLTLEERVEKVLDDTALARIEGSDANDTIKKWTEFSLGTKLKDDHIGLILLSLFGSVSSAVKETTAINHTFTVAQDNLHESLTIAEKSGNEDLRYAGCVIEQLEITGALGDYVRYIASGKAQLQASAANTIAHAQEYDFKPQDIVFKNAVNQAGLTAAQETKVREFKLTIAQNLFDEDVLGSNVPNDFLNQQFTVSGSVTLVHDGSVLQDFMLADTYRAMRFDLIGSTTIGATSNPQLQIDLDRVSIDTYDRSRTPDEIIMETITFTGHYDLTNTSMIKAILTNEIASY